MALHNPWQGSHPLRLRHLLDMSGGLRDLRLHHVFSRQHGADTPLARLLVGDPALLRLRTPPGEQFSYSNLSFHLLGMVIERTVGERHESWIAHELLLPLGMAHSSLFVPSAVPTPARTPTPIQVPAPAPISASTPAPPLASAGAWTLAAPGPSPALLPLRAMGPLADLSPVPPQSFAMRPAGN